MIPSYPSIYGLGHAALNALNVFNHYLVVMEKIDGSQFSFMLDRDGELHFRSKNAVVNSGAAGMFDAGVKAIENIRDRLKVGYIYRGEYLSKPKHNSLAYSRVPNHHVILFDVETAPNDFLQYEDLKAEADRIGLEVVPTVYVGLIKDADHVKSLLTQESVLGGVVPEGLVFKAYGLYGPDKKTLMGKYVTEAFKEVHRSEWKKSNPTRADVIDALIAEMKTEARWMKSIYRLRDEGVLTNTPKDIGPLLKDISKDILKEEEDYIKEKLFKAFWDRISRGAVAGFPQFYKDLLLQESFNATSSD